MPRKRKTMSGADAQSIQSVPGQRYGEGPDQAALQATLPAPDTQGQVPSAAPPAPTVTGPMPVDPGQIQQFLAGHNPALLSGTRQPDTPVTDGLSTGPGRGPAALKMNVTPIARFYDRLAADTGNQKWKRLAERAGLR